ncbi:MAG TPA: hypothetical protein VE967_02095 [Gemmatimonadaceae bacterium]|nr:hypothetical protein [Gemmatimonadaceae bacterium]
MTRSLIRSGAAAALALLALHGGSVAHAQQPRTTDPASVPELKTEFDRAAKLGLNAEILVAKARQGYLGAASTGKIRSVVHAYTDRLVAARDALAPVHDDAELVAGAEVMQKDVPASVLRTLRAAQRTQSLVVAIGALQDLVEIRGVSVKQATDMVLTMVKNHATDTQIASVGQKVQEDVALGLAPSLAMEVRLKGVLSLPQGPAASPQLAPNRRQ